MQRSVFNRGIQILRHSNRTALQRQRWEHIILSNCVLQRHQWLGSGERFISSNSNNLPFSTDTTNDGARYLRPESIFVRHFSSDRTSTRTMKEDIEEYTLRAKTGNHTKFDEAIIPQNKAQVFPRIKTTSLSTKRMIIHDEARAKPVTLVLVAFRSFADNQLDTWRTAFSSQLGHDGQWFDITINESFGAQALSGFVQRWQRGKTAPEFHDYYVAFNSKAREPLERLLCTENRMYGNVMLLDREARVRFRASGAADEPGINALVSCARAIIREDQKAE